MMIQIWVNGPLNIQNGEIMKEINYELIKYTGCRLEGYEYEQETPCLKGFIINASWLHTTNTSYYKLKLMKGSKTLFYANKEEIRAANHLIVVHRKKRGLKIILTKDRYNTVHQIVADLNKQNTLERAFHPAATITWYNLNTGKITAIWHCEGG